MIRYGYDPLAKQLKLPGYLPSSTLWYAGLQWAELRAGHELPHHDLPPGVRGARQPRHLPGRRHHQAGLRGQGRG